MEVTKKFVEDFASTNDDNYGRCETCKYFGQAIHCDDCKDGGGYEFDWEHYLDDHRSEIEAKTKNLRKFNVSIAVDGRIDVEVYAESFDEAFAKAETQFMFADLANMEVVGSKPVNAERDDGEFKDYND